MSGKSVLGISLGDTTGAGSEIIVKLAVSRLYSECCRPVVIGDIRISEGDARTCDLEIPVQIVSKVGEAGWIKSMPVLDQRDVDPEQAPSADISIGSGRARLNILKTATGLYWAGRIDGLYFTPLNKQATIQAGCPFESEHHYMARLFGHTDPFGEISVSGDLWTIRITSHIPISKVSESLTVDIIMRAIGLADASFKNSGIEKPRLALAALNPHCGEDGKYGREEIDVIAPTIEEARKMEIGVDRPFPSDTLFIKALNRDFDGVVTMYHGQGQTALKLKGSDQGITTTGGLPALIATCAHGTTYNIVRKGVVKTSAFENAIEMAAKITARLKGY